MPVNSLHPQYQAMQCKWERMRDSIGGEDAIKKKKDKYLPLPPGIDKPWGSNDPAYLNYLNRAPYPEIVAPTIQGMVGLMERKAPEIKIPSALNRLMERATPDGIGLEELLARMRQEVLALGRYILFVDAPAEGGDPFIVAYPAESLINWRSEGDKITMAVFEETINEPMANDPFEYNEDVQWRVASIESGIDDQGNPTGFPVYVVRVWRRVFDEDGNEQFFIESESFPVMRGGLPEGVPVVTVGSRDLLPDPDQIPLIGVANKALDYYRQVADYRLGLFMSTQATPYGIGLDKGEVPTMVGPTAFWAASNPDARFGYVEVSGAGLSAQRQALVDTRSEILDAAMRVLGDGRRSAESGEALRLRFQSQTATLTTVATATADGLAAALRMIAHWVGADDSSIEVIPDLDFIRQTADPNLLSSITDSVERGMMPDAVLYDYLRRVSLTDMTDEELRMLSPAAQALPSGDDEV